MREHERKAVCMMPISLREHSANRRAGPGETVGPGLPVFGVRALYIAELAT